MWQYLIHAHTTLRCLHKNDVRFVCMIPHALLTLFVLVCQNKYRFIYFCEHNVNRLIYFQHCTWQFISPFHVTRFLECSPFNWNKTNRFYRTLIFIYHISFVLMVRFVRVSFYKFERLDVIIHRSCDGRLHWKQKKVI
jgi:hypothetical protein